MSEKDMPQWVTEERGDRAAVLPGKIGRYLWVTITARHSDKTEDEKASLWMTNPLREREKWIGWAEQLIDAIDAARRAEQPPGEQETVNEARILIVKAMQLHKRDLFATGPGEDVEKRKERGKAALPKFIQSLKDLVKMQQELQAKHFAEWNNLSHEEQADSFLAGMEAWPALAREHMALRLKELFPQAFHKAATGLKAVK